VHAFVLGILWKHHNLEKKLLAGSMKISLILIAGIELREIN
jgi:hypothetical protein